MACLATRVMIRVSIALPLSVLRLLTQHAERQLPALISGQDLQNAERTRSHEGTSSSSSVSSVSATSGFRAAGAHPKSHHHGSVLENFLGQQWLVGFRCASTVAGSSSEQTDSEQVEILVTKASSKGKVKKGGPTRLGVQPSVGLDEVLRRQNREFRGFEVCPPVLIV